MAKSLNFNTLKKAYMSVTLADENKTTLMIGTPTKQIMDDLLLIAEKISDVDDGAISEDTTDDLYHACARVMSRNKGGIKISADQLAEFFDFEDIVIFFDAYMEFVSEVTNAKN